MKRTAQCKHGIFTYETADHWIGGALDRWGEYSEPEVQKLLSLIDETSVVIEVGANIGSITVPLAKKARYVFAFEPQPQNFALLCENINQNRLTEKCDREALIVSDERGVGAMPLIDFDKGNINSGAASVVASGEGTVEVKKITLDDDFELDLPISLIKVDVEGHELQVLRGARKTIAKHRPILYVENDRHEHSADLIELIMGMGYVCFWHLPELKNPAPEAVDRPYVSVNMLCFHKDAEFRPEWVADCRKIMTPHSDWSFELQRMNEAKPPEVQTSSVKANEWACVVRLGGVGDDLMASSVLPYLKRKYGHVEVIAASPQHVVFENNPNIDKLTVKPPGDPDWGGGQSWQDYWVSRAKEYSFFANLSHSCETLRAAIKVQTQYYWPASARRKFLGGSYLEAVADICEVPYEELRPQFFPTVMEWEHAQETKRLVGGKYIAWILSGTRVDKIWPNNGVCIAKIIKELGIPVVLVGAPGRDFELAKMIQEYVQNANGSLSGLHTCISVDPNRPNWPIRRVLTQTLAADLVITPDTGPAWAVSFEDMPKIVMLSHASKENITKYWKNTVTLHADPSRVKCWPCHLLIDTPADCERLSGRPAGGAGAACISDISVDDVMREVRKAIT